MANSNRQKEEENLSQKTSVPLVSPIMDWLQLLDETQIRRKRQNISVPTQSFKSQVSEYHNDPSNPAPVDLVMATAGQMSHPAFTMKESIGPTYLLFGKVRFFTYERHPEGLKELLDVDWCY